MSKTILVPVDLSLNAKQAITVATALAHDLKARVVIVYVEEISRSDAFYAGLPESRGDELRRMLNEIPVGDPAISVERRILVGRPAEAIGDAARDEAADFIVMSTHGRTGVLHLLMGSVAEKVVRSAPCPVILVRCGKPADQFLSEPVKT